MGKVIELPCRQPRSQGELVEFYNDMAAKAARGENTGLIFLTLDSEGDTEWGMCGEYATNLELASEAVTDGMTEFLAYKAEVEVSRALLEIAHRNHQKFQDDEYIERLLREA